MTRGEAEVTKLHYKGKAEDFLIFVESPKAVQEWKNDSSKPLVDVVDSFKIFVTHKQGAQGAYDGASKSALANEFGSSNEEECIKLILEKGNIQETKMPEHSGSTNDSNGGKAMK